MSQHPSLKSSGGLVVKRNVLKRFERVVCSGIDRNGQKIELEGTGLFARCLQHEMDHLDGILYTDKAQNVRPAVTEEEQAEAAAVEAEAAGVARIADEVALSH